MAAVNAPVWLLDIDGVVNAVTDTPDHRVWPRDQWVRATATCAGGEAPLLAARPVLEFIRRVHRQRRAEIRWHSTWQHEARAVAAALDLPDLPVQRYPELPGPAEQTVAEQTDARQADARQIDAGQTSPEQIDAGGRWWKLSAALSVVGHERRPLLWTDDEVDMRLPRSGGSDLFGDAAVLIVCPRSERGLTVRHLHRISAFLDETGRHAHRSRSLAPRSAQSRARKDQNTPIRP